MKICIECKVSKPLDAFYSHRRAKDKRQGVCAACHRERMRIQRLTDPAVQQRDRARYHQPARKAISQENAARWRQEHPEAYRAQTAVGNAVRDGKLMKAPCAMCGINENVQGHHRDYSRPLDVTWLCAKCHHRLHATFPELGGHFEAVG